MAKYIFSPVLEAFLELAVARMKAGFGCSLFLEGPAGAGKTSFAHALAEHLGGRCFYYSGNPDKERDLLYEIDVEGVVTRKGAWVEGPAWEAFQATTEGQFAVLLIDEIDKTNPGFDSFLLRLLEEWTFRAPGGKEIKADPTRLAVVLTSNGRRELRPEVLRRCQRIHVPMPENGRLERIIRQIAGVEIPNGLLDLAVRIGSAVRRSDEDNAPSPKELALCCVDLLRLARVGQTDSEIWRQVAASWLIKSGGAKVLDGLAEFKWTRALMGEATKK